ncbi:MAG: hypothetical protein ACAI35_25525 [Candidatus Methylacidiphilales bacterium]
MKPTQEISYLYITDGELYHWLGPDASAALVTERGWETRVFLATMVGLVVFVVASVLIGAYWLLPATASAFVLWAAWMLLLVAAVPLTIVAALAWVLNRWVRRYLPASFFRTALPNRNLALTRGLIAKARKFNDLIRQIELVNKLRDLGHEITYDVDNQVIASLRGVREELRRAMQTDRLLRHHPVQSPIIDLDFNIAGCPEVIETKMAAQEHSVLLKEAMEISAQVREDMDRLVRSAGNRTASSVRSTVTEMGFGSSLDPEPKNEESNGSGGSTRSTQPTVGQ